MVAAVPFVSRDGRFQGWKVILPGLRPLATPAVANGRVFLGGGFGSHEFYAFDAFTGALLWEYHTKDDGPTAAIVLEGLVAFNTESCELEVLSVDGTPVWKAWLGDPLMSMPAAVAGKIYMAYPHSKGDKRHYLACFDLHNGQRLWEQPIQGEIITAPVLAEDNVYASTLEGSLHCFRAADGHPIWHDQKEATSSPVIWQGQCYFSRRQETTRNQAGRNVLQQTEVLAGTSSRHLTQTASMASTTVFADYLDYSKRAAHSARETANSRYDGAVGFAHSKGDAKIDQARRHLGHGTVAGIWAYQGSKPFLAHGRLYSAMGDTLKCVDPMTERVVWEENLHQEPGLRGELLDSVLTPPCLVNGKVFLGTTLGEVVCLSAETGEKLWQVDVGEPIVFQPAVVDGRVFVATHSGSLVSFATGDARDGGWSMWGANPAHNGVPVS